MTPFLLQTERLRLMPLSLQQLVRVKEGEPIDSVLGLPAAEGLISPPVLKALEVKISRMSGLSEPAHPWLTYWLMILNADSAGIGLAGFKGAPDADGQVELGYGIARAYERRGYTTEAVNALVEWAFSQPDCRVIIAETRCDNPASQRVLVKAGFRRQAGRDELIFWRLERGA